MLARCRISRFLNCKMTQGCADYYIRCLMSSLVSLTIENTMKIAGQSSITEWVEILTASGYDDEAYDGCVSIPTISPPNLTTIALPSTLQHTRARRFYQHPGHGVRLSSPDPAADANPATDQQRRPAPSARNSSTATATSSTVHSSSVPTPPSTCITEH